MKRIIIITLFLLAVFGSLGAQPIRNEVLVEGGTFTMGSGNGEVQERPMHDVRISSFWIMKTEVTQADWMAIMGSNPSKSKGDKLPVSYVNWSEAVEYANKLSRKDGLQPAYRMFKGDAICDFTKNGWRLPTEAEWEYAAMGGNQSEGYDYAGSNSPRGVAWYKDNSDSSAHPVGSTASNELGIYDMSGNVWEWCQDWYDEGYYAKSPSADPRGPSSGTDRVRRGGSRFSEATEVRVSYRGSSVPAGQFSDVGFRLVRPQF